MGCQLVGSCEIIKVVFQFLVVRLHKMDLRYGYGVSYFVLADTLFKLLFGFIGIVYQLEGRCYHYIIYSGQHIYALQLLIT